MELKVKTKVINGKKVKGIINENLKEIAEFIFVDIHEFQLNEYESKYYICECEDGTCSLYDYNGICRISYKEGFKIEKILKYSIRNRRNDNIKVVVTKNKERGIVRASLDWKTKKPMVEVVYNFGKCDEINELEDDTVELIKHTKGEDRIGYFYHENLDGIVDPTFLSYDYFRISSKKIGLYKLSDGNGTKGYPSYQKSDHIEKEKFTFNTELIQYTESKKNKKVMGIMQKVYNSSKKTDSDFIFVDFLKGKYVNIQYDEKNQLFYLEERKNGKIKKGLVGVTFDWYLSSKGWMVYGYPNLKIVINIPCEYDELEVIDNKYIKVKKEGKYGLLKFGFNKSNGDYGYDNRRRYSNEYCYEVAPCIYDDIRKEGDNFVGRINEEEKIIVDARDFETGEYVTIQNQYEKVHALTYNIYLCELPTGKKEVVIVHKFREYWNQKEYDCDFTIISPCDDAIVVNKQSNGLVIKVTDKNETSAYFVIDGKPTLAEEDIVDVTYDEETNHYIIYKKNGHITFINQYGEKEFATENLGIIPKNLSAEYLTALAMFQVTNDNKINLYKSRNQKNEIFENRTFLSFTTLKVNNNLFVGYTELKEETEETKLVRLEMKDGNWKEIELLRGHFQVENIVLNGKRIIFSTIDYKDNQKKYGVIESQEGNVCLDCTYKDIQFDFNNQMFICKNNTEEILFDSEGFIMENLNNLRNIHGPKLTLTIKKQNVEN